MNNQNNIPENGLETVRPEHVVVAETGRDHGIHWVRGYLISIDAQTETILEVKGVSPSWTDRELRQDAFRVYKKPSVGDKAPEGWEKWRRSDEAAHKIKEAFSKRLKLEINK
ncbi:hypothetical protein GF376_00680 [Candidatus Peregrinibacteria bacterium]|nr:hypothetical protein [Candidatus Peregrinibacteria bacterium]